MQRATGLMMLWLSAGCQSVLDLDGYSFPDGGGAGGGSGTGGTSSEPGARSSGDAGAGSGVSGSGTGSFDASTPLAGESDAAVTPLPDGGGDAGQPLACAPSERCMPALPEGWQGPIALGANGSASCPSGYPTAFDELHQDLQIGAAACGCDCSPGAVTCHLASTTTGLYFEPPPGCGAPLAAGECIVAAAEATCDPLPASSIEASVWGTTQPVCGDASATGACDGGTCYPALDQGGLCISALGEQPCPDGFSNPTLYYQTIDDRRACSECSCSPHGQACVFNLVACTFGFPFTLEDGAPPFCDITGSGDSIAQDSQGVINAASCTAAGGVLEGTVGPSHPVTVCCLE